MWGTTRLLSHFSSRALLCLFSCWDPTWILGSTTWCPCLQAWPVLASSSPASRIHCPTNDVPAVCQTLRLALGLSEEQGRPGHHHGHLCLSGRLWLTDGTVSTWAPETPSLILAVAAVRCRRSVGCVPCLTQGSILFWGNRTSDLEKSFGILLISSQGQIR